jgi:hypothetical protein
MLMNELVEMHKEWLPIPPRTTAAAARALVEEVEVAIELRRLNQKIRKLKDQAQICNYVWVFIVGMVITVVVMLILYGKALIWEEFVSLKLYEKMLKEGKINWKFRRNFEQWLCLSTKTGFDVSA